MKTLTPQINLSPTLHRTMGVVSKILLASFGILIVLLLFGITTKKNVFATDEDAQTVFLIMFNLLGFMFLLVLALGNFHRWKISIGLFSLGVSISVLLFTSWLTYRGETVTIVDSPMLAVGMGGLLAGGLLLMFGKRDTIKKVEYAEADETNKKYLARRIFAFFIDCIIFSFVVAFCLLLFGEPAPSDDPLVFDKRVSNGLSLLIIFWLWVAYFPGLEARIGQTAGKAVMGIQVVRINENLHPFRVSFLRHTLDVVEFISIGLISIGLMMITKSNRRLGDFVAGSKIIKA